MIMVDIDKLPDPYSDVISNFYYENHTLPNQEFIEKFEKTFRCKTIRKNTNGWYMQFKDEDYTWFLLAWS